jgi:hypothetical protein
LLNLFSRCRDEDEQVFSAPAPRRPKTPKRGTFAQRFPQTMMSPKVAAFRRKSLHGQKEWEWEHCVLEARGQWSVRFRIG